MSNHIYKQKKKKNETIIFNLFEYFTRKKLVRFVVQQIKPIKRESHSDRIAN